MVPARVVPGCLPQEPSGGFEKDGDLGTFSCTPSDPTVGRVNNPSLVLRIGISCCGVDLSVGIVFQGVSRSSCLVFSRPQVVAGRARERDDGVYGHAHLDREVGRHDCHDGDERTSQHHAQNLRILDYRREIRVR